MILKETTKKITLAALAAFFTLTLISLNFGQYVRSQHTLAPQVSTTVVISQFQVAGVTAADEFVEIHNVSNSTVTLTGYTIAYRAAAGATDVSPNIYTFPSGTTLAAGKYFLIVGTGYSGTVTADASVSTGFNGLAGAGGGIAIRNSGTVVDSVGYGNATNTFVEGTRTTAPASGTSQARATAGCTDTDNNSTDFTNLNPSAPRNSSIAPNICNVVTAAEGEIGGRVTSSRTNRPLENVTVTLSGGSLIEPIVVYTDQRGRYRFTEIPVNAIYIVTVESKRHRFYQSSTALSLIGNAENVDFVGEGW